MIEEVSPKKPRLNQKKTSIHKKEDFRLYVAIPAVAKEHAHNLPKVKDAIAKALEGYKYDFYVAPVGGSSNQAEIVDGFNLVVETVLRLQYNYVWFVEGDVVVPPDAFTRLHAHNVDVAAGVVPYHKIAPVYENLMVAGRFLSEGSYRTVNLHKDDVKGKTLEGNVWAGSSCVLIKRGVFESGLRYVHQLETAGFDMLFWKSAKLRGFKILVDGNVVCEDLG